MGHANPEWKKEGQLIRYMIEQAYFGNTDETHFLRQLKQGIKEVYGEPLQEESPHFITRIEDLLLDYPSTGQYSFREARIFLLAEFYPGKEGFYAVKEYWRSKRREANGTH